MCIGCAQNGLAAAESVGLDGQTSKVIAIGAAAVMMFSAAIPMANPTTQVKAGAVCVKANQKVVKSGKTFVCKKSGKKLIWKVQVKKTTKPSGATDSRPVAQTRNNAGDPCAAVGQRETNSFGYLECREVANKAKKYFQLSDSPVAPPLNVSPESIDVCRIPDQSTTDRSQGPSIAYPIPSGKRYASIPRVGEINAAIIPIDFPDSPGAGSPSVLYNEMISKVNDWMKWYSQGKSFYKFQVHDSWIRAPKNSSEYVPADHISSRPEPAANYKTGRQINGLDIISEYLDLAEDHFDYDKMHTVFILYPKDVKNIWTGIWKLGIKDSRGPIWSTTDDPRLIGKWATATGARDNYYNFPVWSFFLHENLHNQGLQGHAPNQGYNLGIMTNQYGLSLPLSSWDTLIIDWQFENQFYCVSKENVKPASVVLSPLEREELGTKAIMVKLSRSQVLVIESRRKDKWSSGYRGFPGLPDGFYGVVVYKVDTTATPQYGVIEPDGANWRDSSDAHAYFIRNQNVDHGTIPGAPQSGPIDMNFVMYEGESLTTNGIKISLVKSGDHDEVKIERAD